MPRRDPSTRSRLVRALPILQAMQQVYGHLYDDEADLLIAAAVDALTRTKAPQTVVEIGSFYGKSTVGLGLVAKAIGSAAKVYAIDPHEGLLSLTEPSVNVEPTFACFMANIANAGLSTTVVPIKERSTNVRWSEPISMLFIDGLHDYDNVSHDFAHFAPWVVPGGYVAFHDYGKPDFPGVTAFVDEINDLGYCRPVERASGLILLQKSDQRRRQLRQPFPIPRLWPTRRTGPTWAASVLMALRARAARPNAEEPADERGHEWID